MLEFSSFAAIVLAFTVVTVSPGPANLAVAAVAMQFGRRKGLVFAAGLASGLAFWGVVAASGLGAVLQNAAWALFLLKLAGGVYLLWLAVLALRSATKPAQDNARAPASARWFRRGLLLNMSNPKAVVAWTAALSMGLGASDGGAELAAATALCALIGLANYALHAIVFSLGGAMALYRRARRWVDGVVAGLFAIAGVGLIRSAFAR